MADKPPAIDAEFRLVEDRWRPPVKRTLFCMAYIGLCAAAAYHINDRGLSAAMVCISGLVWPVVRFLVTISEKVSVEQEDWMRERMDPRRPSASPHPRRQRLSHQSR